MKNLLLKHKNLANKVNDALATLNASKKQKVKCTIFAAITIFIFVIPIVLLLVEFYLQYIFVKFAVVILNICSLLLLYLVINLGIVLYYRALCAILDIDNKISYKEIFVANFFDVSVMLLMILFIIIFNVFFILILF